MTESYAGEIVSLVFMAVALGMDSFSVSLGMGMKQLRLKRILWIGIVFGLFHIMLPSIGIAIGKVLLSQVGQFATVAGGLLLVGLGTQMLLTAFNHENKKIVQPLGIGLIVLALSVSVDSFSVGLGLGLSGVKTIVALLLFGVISAMFTWAGLLLGRKMRGLLGVYSEILGGSILCAFGLQIIFG